MLEKQDKQWGDAERICLDLNTMVCTKCRECLRDCGVQEVMLTVRILVRMREWFLWVLVTLGAANEYCFLSSLSWRISMFLLSKHKRVMND